MSCSCCEKCLGMGGGVSLEKAVRGVGQPCGPRARYEREPAVQLSYKNSQGRYAAKQMLLFMSVTLEEETG